MRGSMHTFAPSPPETSLTLPPRRAFTVTELIVVGVILVLLLALLLPPVTRSRPDASRRMACKNNLKQIGLALYNYRDQYGTFPPVFSPSETGEPSLSWRTMLLPFLDELALHKQIDSARAWDDPVHADIAEQLPQRYHCPSMRQPKGRTTYLALVNRDGTMGVRFKPPKDFGGDRDVILVLDVTETDAVQWMSPRDVTIEQLGALSWEEGRGHPGILQALFQDGSVRAIDRRTWPWELADEPTSLPSPSASAEAPTTSEQATGRNR